MGGTVIHLLCDRCSRRFPADWLAPICGVCQRHNHIGTPIVTSRELVAAAKDCRRNIRRAR